MLVLGVAFGPRATEVEVRDVDTGARVARGRARHVDLGPDVDIDDLTSLAARLCGTPMAVVSLVDAERQWFKSRHGDLTLTETPRDVSFCTHTIEGLVMGEP